MPSDLEAAFLTRWKQLAPRAPAPTPEYPFAAHIKRKFRFDFAWLPQKVAVELEGGLYSRGAHARPVGIERDIEKGNLAVLLGWRVLRFSTKMLTNDPARSIGAVQALLAGGPCGI